MIFDVCENNLNIFYAFQTSTNLWCFSLADLSTKKIVVFLQTLIHILLSPLNYMITFLSLRKFIGRERNWFKCHHPIRIPYNFDDSLFYSHRYHKVVAQTYKFIFDWKTMTFGDDRYDLTQDNFLLTMWT